MSHKVSIKDIAKALGLSPSTVSYALRDSANISAKTKERVADKAAEMGYQSDPALRQLMSYVRDRRGRVVAHALAFINSSPTPRWADLGVRAQAMMTAMHKRAETLGYHIDELWIGKAGKDTKTLRRILEARNIKGIILHHHNEAFQLPELNWSQHTVVCFDTLPPNCSYNHVGHSTFRGMRTAMDNLRQLGYRRIGLAIENRMHAVERDQWLASYRFEHTTHSELKTLPECPCKVVDPDLCVANWGYRPQPGTAILDRDYFATWLKETKPDCVLTYERKVLEWIQEEGLKVPEDIGVALLDCPLDLHAASGIDQDVAAIGETVVNTLVAQVESNSMGIPDNPKYTRINGVWKSGQTTRQQ